MRASHRFRPSSVQALEGRVVLSQVVPLAGEVRPVQLTAAEIAQSNASDVPFGFGPGETLASGFSVAEQRTTTYNDGSTQTESLLEVPNLAKNTVTSYETINLRNNGGTEKVVDTESFSGGSQPLSGDENTHTITTTLPDGSIQTQTYTEIISGRTTVVNGTIHEPGGGVETWTSDKVKVGPKTTANKTITEPDGTIEHQTIVTINRGDLDSTSKTTTTSPGEIQRTSSATNVIRVQPPSA